MQFHALSWKFSTFIQQYIDLHCCHTIKIDCCYDLPLIFSFLGLIFSFLAITHPSHVTGPLTSLVFVIASFHLLLWTSMTHSSLLILYVLLHNSITFYHDPFTLLSLRYINPWLVMYSPKLDLLCTLVHFHTNLVSLFLLFFEIGYVMIRPYSFLFSRTYFSFSAITHPSHVIGPLTPLVFVIASFHPFPRTSLTHSCLLICTSSRFHRIPPCSICFVIVPELSESQVYKPSTRYIFP